MTNRAVRLLKQVSLQEGHVHREVGRGRAGHSNVKVDGEVKRSEYLLWVWK